MEKVLINNVHLGRDPYVNIEDGILNVVGGFLSEESFHHMLINEVEKYVFDISIISFQIQFISRDSQSCIVELLNMCASKNLDIHVKWFCKGNCKNYRRIAKELESTTELDFEIIEKVEK